MNVELLAAIVSIYFAAASNTAFWRASAAAGAFDGPNGWAVAPSLFVALVTLHFMLLCCMLSRLTAKVTLTLLLIVTSFVSHFATEYSVILDAEMMHAVLQSDARESSEFLTTGLLMSMLIQGILPSILVWRVRLTRYSWPYAIAMRSMSVFVAISPATAAIQLTYHEIASLMRNHQSLRYLITPGNIVVAVANMLMEDRKATSVARRQVVALDAVLNGHPPNTRSLTLVIVVGETVRAQNCELSGYTRPTTPVGATSPAVHCRAGCVTT
jgi:lipid A ethanolaminephosphotransferase